MLETEVLLARELLDIRGTYRFVDRVALDTAVAALRRRLDTDLAEPLSVHYVIVGVTLVVDIVVPMFSDHGYAADWCGQLSRTALTADYDVLPYSLAGAP